MCPRATHQLPQSRASRGSWPTVPGTRPRTEKACRRAACGPWVERFKAHIAIERDTGLFTAQALSKASGADSSDATIGVDLLTAETEHVQVLGDSAYGSGIARATLAEGGHEAPTP